jgi:hypothetical protein
METITINLPTGLVKKMMEKAGKMPLFEGVELTPNNFIHDLLMMCACKECGSYINGWSMDNDDAKSSNYWTCNGGCGKYVCDECVRENYEEFDDFVCKDCDKEEVPPECDEDGYDLKCGYCNSRNPDTKVDGVWIHADCE